MNGSRWLRRIGALATALFTVYLLLDTFVIEKSYAAASSAEAESALFAAAETQSAACTLTPLSAEKTATALTLPADAQVIGSAAAEGYAVTLYTFRADDTQIYAADVTVASAQSLRTAFAEDTYGRNLTDKTSSIAAEVGAILAINGDFYGSRESGLVIRNGVLYRESAKDGEVLVVYADGSFAILPAGEASGEELLAAGAWQAFSFGPGLVADGELSVSAGEEVGRSMSSNPRTAIGILGEGHYLFLVSDGRTAQSAGLSLLQLAELMRALGCTQAYNLDGGGSSTMVFRGEVVNNPTTSGRKITERSVSDIVWIG